MKSEDCELRDECLTFLCEFPDRIPHRCRLCTPMVKFTLERIRDMHEDEHGDGWRKDVAEVDIWNE